MEKWGEGMVEGGLFGRDDFEEEIGGEDMGGGGGLWKSDFRRELKKGSGLRGIE